MTRVELDDAGWRRLGKKLLKQVPYASSVAINSTAFKARVALKARTKEAFKLRNTWTLKGLRVKLGKKAAPGAVVWHTDPWMGRQEEGGVKAAAKVGAAKGIPRTRRVLRVTGGKGHLAIPPGGAGAYGRVMRRSQRPAKLLQRKRHFIQRSKAGHVFIGERLPGKEPGTRYRLTKAGKRRKAKRRLRRSFRVKFGFVTRATVPRRYRFKATGMALVGREWSREFAKAWLKAMRTAR